LSRKREGGSTAFPFVSTAEQLSQHIFLTEESKKDIQEVSEIFPLKIPVFYLNLMDRENPACPLRKQSVPSKDELLSTGHIDPLDEQRFLVTPSFIKKYPNRGVFLAASHCAMFCRFCNRRRFVGRSRHPMHTWEESFDHMKRDGDLTEVIVSGGDPFTLPREDFSYMMRRLKNIERIRVIRISTRLPVVCPEGVDKDHFKTLKKSSPIWIVIHINHPREVSPEFVDVIKKLSATGASIVSQTVLLRGVNDCPHILLRLFELLVAQGVKPYYLFQFDEVKGAMHFKVRIQEGIHIMHFLRRHGSGLAMPQYALDITGGYGKVPLDHNYVKRRKGTSLHLESPSGDEGIYIDNGKKGLCQDCGICGRKTAEVKKIRS